MSASEVLPGWVHRPLLDELIAAQRPPVVSFRSTGAVLALLAAGAAFVLAAWVGFRYAGLVDDCTAAAARYADGSLYCAATPALSSSGYCQIYRGETAMDVCMSHSAVHPETMFTTAATGFLLLFVASLLAGWWWLARRSLPPFVDVLTRRAHDVCWVYVRQTTFVDPRFASLRRSSSVVVIALANRQTAEIGPLRDQDAAQALLSIAPLVPRATVGHTAAAAAAYARDPRSLFRA